MSWTRESAMRSGRGPMSARTGSNLVLELEATILDELEHGDRCEGLREAREAEEARGLDGNGPRLVRKPVAAHQEEPVLVGDSKARPGHVPFLDQRHHE